MFLSDLLNKVSKSLVSQSPNFGIHPKKKCLKWSANLVDLSKKIKDPFFQKKTKVLIERKESCNQYNKTK